MNGVLFHDVSLRGVICAEQEHRGQEKRQGGSGSRSSRRPPALEFDLPDVRRAFSSLNAGEGNIVASPVGNVRQFGQSRGLGFVPSTVSASSLPGSDSEVDVADLDLEDGPPMHDAFLPGDFSPSSPASRPLPAVVGGERPRQSATRPQRALSDFGHRRDSSGSPVDPSQYPAQYFPSSPTDVVLQVGDCSVGDDDEENDRPVGGEEEDHPPV